MRVAGSVLALLFALVSAHGQATVERVNAPDAVICGVGWSLPGSPPPAERTILSLEYRLPDGPGLPTRSEPPDDSQKSPPSLPASKPGPKKRAPAVRAHLEVENRGGKVIKAISWEVSLMDVASGKERRRLRFRTETEVQPGKVVPQEHEFPLDEDWRWFQASKGRAARVVVRIESLVYADGSEWRRE